MIDQIIEVSTVHLELEEKAVSLEDILASTTINTLHEYDFWLWRRIDGEWMTTKYNYIDSQHITNSFVHIYT